MSLTERISNPKARAAAMNLGTFFISVESTTGFSINADLVIWLPFIPMWQKY